VVGPLLWISVRNALNPAKRINKTQRPDWGYARPRMDGSSVRRSALNSTAWELVLYNSNQSFPLVDCAIHSLMRRLVEGPSVAGEELAER